MRLERIVSKVHQTDQGSWNTPKYSGNFRLSQRYLRDSAESLARLGINGTHYPGLDKIFSPDDLFSFLDAATRSQWRESDIKTTIDGTLGNMGRVIRSFVHRLGYYASEINDPNKIVNDEGGNPRKFSARSEEGHNFDFYYHDRRPGRNSCVARFNDGLEIETSSTIATGMDHDPYRNIGGWGVGNRIQTIKLSKPGQNGYWLAELGSMPIGSSYQIKYKVTAYRDGCSQPVYVSVRDGQGYLDHENWCHETVAP